MHYILIPLFWFLVAGVGGVVTGGGIDNGWYGGISKPAWTPDGVVIGAVWTTIFVLTSLSMILSWNNKARFARGRFGLVVGLFVINGALNVLWSYLFFGQHLLGAAVFEAGILGLSVVALITLIRPVSRLASSLLFLYLIWVAFATYLTYTVWMMN
jgi:translocator protein